jgi:hypothetical protein
MKATAIMVRIRMPTHIRADRHPGLSIVGLRLPSSAEPCPWPGFEGGTRIDDSPNNLKEHPVSSGPVRVVLVRLCRCVGDQEGSKKV